jgi:hypothetical protein
MKHSTLRSLSLLSNPPSDTYLRNAPNARIGTSTTTPPYSTNQTRSAILPQQLPQIQPPSQTKPLSLRLYLALYSSLDSLFCIRRTSQTTSTSTEMFVRFTTIQLPILWFFLVVFATCLMGYASSVGCRGLMGTKKLARLIGERCFEVLSAIWRPTAMTRLSQRILGFWVPEHH